MTPRFPHIAALLALCAAWSLSGCLAFRETKQERAVLDFEVEGIALGSHPSKLGKFPQVQALSGQPQGTLVYQIFNPNSQISAAIFLYEKNALKSMELRYFKAPGMTSLDNAGGWDGILNYMVEKYGPPSDEGPQVPVISKLPGINPQIANFNGEWIFSRVRRQLNFVAQVTDPSGMAAVNIEDTTPPHQKKKKHKPLIPLPEKKHPDPWPGF